MPNVTTKTDINHTRVAARYNMLHSILRLYNGLKNYAEKNHTNWELTDSEWQTIVEMEAVLRVIKDFSTIVQSEQFCLGGLGFIIRRNLLKSVRADSFDVIDLSNISPSKEITSMCKES